MMYVIELDGWKQFSGVLDEKTGTDWRFSFV